MSKINTGGAAFSRTGFYPETGSVHNEDLPNVLDTRTEPQRGMTLRDYFAAAALTGLLARKVTTTADSLADQAHELADAMIRRRDA